MAHVVAFVVIAIIAYGIADGGTEKYITDFPSLTEGTSKMVGAGLYLFYFLAAVAVATMLGFGLRKMFK